MGVKHTNYFHNAMDRRTQHEFAMNYGNCHLN